MTGTQGSPLQAGNFSEAIEQRHGLEIPCPEEIAFRQRWIDAGLVERLARPLAWNSCGRYLLALLADPLDAHGP